MNISINFSWGWYEQWYSALLHLLVAFVSASILALMLWY